MKRIELEVEGSKYVLRELTLGEASEVFEKTVIVEFDDNMKARPRMNLGLMRLMLLERCVDEPKMSRDEIYNLPMSVARKLLDKCAELNPDFKGV